MKKKLDLIFAMVFFCLPAVAQRNYLIEYDKLADSFSYYELKYSRGSMKPESISKPKVELGDVVTFKAININTMVFDMSCEVRNVGLGQDESSTGNPVLGAFLGFSPMLMMAKSGISDAASLLKTADYKSRGAGKKDLSDVDQDLSKINKQITACLELTQKILSTEKVLSSTELTLDEIKTTYSNTLSGNSWRQLDSMLVSLNGDVELYIPQTPEEEIEFNALKVLHGSLVALVNKNIGFLERDWMNELNAMSFEKEITQSVNFASNLGEYSDPYRYGGVEFFLMFYTSQSNAAISSDKTLSMIRKVYLQRKGAYLPSWTTGVFFAAPFGGREDYGVKYNDLEDSLLVTSSKAPLFKGSVGIQMVFNFNSKGRLLPYAALGTSININKESSDDYYSSGTRYLNLLVGGGVRFADFRYLSLTGGMAFSQMQSLSEGVKVGEWIADTYDGLKESDLFMDRFKPGFYLGMNMHF